MIHDYHFIDLILDVDRFTSDAKFHISGFYNVNKTRTQPPACGEGEDTVVPQNQRQSTPVVVEMCMSPFFI